MSKNKRTLTPLSDHLLPHELNKALNDGSDLVCALIGGTFIDNALGHILQAFMISDPDKGNKPHSVLNSRMGCLSTFSARNDMCYCLGLITKTDFDNIDCIREIRNTFAHSHKTVDFAAKKNANKHETNDVVKFCKTISLKHWGWVRLDGRPIQAKDDDWDQRWITEPVLNAPLPNKWRSKFCWAVGLTHLQLIITHNEVSARRQVPIKLPIIDFCNFRSS